MRERFRAIPPVLAWKGRRVAFVLSKPVMEELVMLPMSARTEAPLGTMTSKP